jgi:hypothetical protein
MKKNDQIRFRQLLLIFVDGLSRYSGDSERMERGLEVLEKWVDTLVNRECSTFLQKNAVISHRGQKKGGGGSIN